MTLRRVAIIGHFGGKKEYCDGQTVKTITVYNALQKTGLITIDKVDTYYFFKNPFLFLLQFIMSLLRDKQYIVLLSSRGRKVLFPILYFMCKCRKDIYHYGIGGRLAREITDNNKWKRYVNSFRYNWMESKELVNKLHELGISNAIYLPNFKELNILQEKELNLQYSAPYKLCTFSRVMDEKGIRDAIEAVHNINHDQAKQIVTLDIYGPGDDKYLTELEEELKQKKDCRYCGVIPAQKSVEVLKNYYALLFPTHWRHEGIPGTIIDALSAGLPTIARRWQYCDEILTNKVNGYTYDFDHPEELRNCILYAITHVDETIAMKANCLAKAYDYSEEYVVKIILEKMGLITGE